MQPEKTHDLKHILRAVREAQGALTRALPINQAPRYLAASIEELGQVAALVEKDLAIVNQGVREEFQKTAGVAVLRGLLTILKQAGCPVVDENYDCLLGQMLVDLTFTEGGHTLTVRVYETGELEYHNVDYHDPEVFAAQLGILTAGGPGRGDDS